MLALQIMRCWRVALRLLPSQQALSTGTTTWDGIAIDYLSSTINRLCVTDPILLDLVDRFTPQAVPKACGLLHSL
jgi:hypothetical protein